MFPPHGLLAGEPAPSVQILLGWCAENDVEISPALSIEERYGGWGLVAKEPLELGAVLYKLPKTSILSVRTSSLPELPFDARPGTSHTILGLSLALLHELRLGRESKFFGYLQSLPRETVPIPTLWPLIEGAEKADAEEALAWLKGTDAERDLRRRDKEGLSLPALREFYDAAKSRLPLTKAHPDPSPFAAFAYAFSLVSTRAFLIDLYHTIALCPFADVANHSSSPHTSLASDDFVCHRCGSLARCVHDIPNPQTGIVERLAHLDPNARQTIGKGRDTVDMYVEWPLKKGQEVFNSYGENLPDSRLLVEWGFVPGAFPDAAPTPDGAAGGSEGSAREDELLAEGVTWSLSELCPDIVAEAWDKMQEEVELAYASRFEASEGSLLCAASPKPIYHINAGGQASLRLWGPAYLDALREVRKRRKKKARSKTASVSLDEASGEVPSDLELLLEDVKQLEQVWEKQEGTLSAANARAAKTMGKLLARRLVGMRKPDLGVGELYDLRESATGLTALALTVVTDEVALLESTLARWEELAAMAEP